MYAGNSSLAFAAPTTDAVNELRDNVEEFAFSSELVNLLLDLWGFVVLDGHECPLS